MNLRHISSALSVTLLSTGSYFAYPSIGAESSENIANHPPNSTAKDAHAFLFLHNKTTKSDNENAPSAALTMHPALNDEALENVQSNGTRNQQLQQVTNTLPESSAMPAVIEPQLSPQLLASAANAPTAASSSAVESATEKLAKPNGPALVAADNLDKSLSGSDETAPLSSSMSRTSSNMLSQLAPDQLVSQSDTAAATPIPPVVTGTVDLEEFKTTNVIDLKVAQSRTFKLKNKIVRTSISDPGIAEPVVVSENQLVLLGKTPGTATLVLWDDAGNSVTIDLHCSRDYSQLQSTLREIDPRIIVKSFSIGGTDRVILMGDVDHPDSIVRAFAASNVFMDDRGMTIQVANSRLVNARVGEQGGSSTGGGGQTGQLAALSSVDRYTFFPNLTNNVGKAQVITSDGARVTSLVKVRKVPLIVLHVSFMEMNSTAAREIGLQLGFNYSSNNMSFGVGGNNSILGGSTSDTSLLTTLSGKTGVGYLSPVNFLSSTTAENGVSSGNVTGIGLGVLNTPASLLSSANLFGSPGGADFTTNGLGNLFTAVSTFGNRHRYSLDPVIQGIISHNRARILSEPTLVTVSGERAAFLAGGEIPIVQSIATAGASQQSVTFEPFGLRLNMIPVLMENGAINLEISPEERIVSTQYSLNLAGSSTSIPGFTTRKVQTIVEMKPGQELFISGLVTANSGRQLTKTPFIGEVPVLGALYRSKAFSKNESELVVTVRPEIILPGTPGQLKLPEEIGRVEGPRDTNLFQVEPTVIDERHYSSGRDERNQKTSPTLPEGSPIPDNE